MLPCNCEPLSRSAHKRYIELHGIRSIHEVAPPSALLQPPKGSVLVKPRISTTGRSLPHLRYVEERNNVYEAAYHHPQFHPASHEPTCLLNINDAYTFIHTHAASIIKFCGGGHVVTTMQVHTAPAKVCLNTNYRTHARKRYAKARVFVGRGLPPAPPPPPRPVAALRTRSTLACTLCVRTERWTW